MCLGSTFGTVAADALAIGAGALARRRLPMHALALFSAGLFLLFGMLALARPAALI